MFYEVMLILTGIIGNENVQPGSIYWKCGTQFINKNAISKYLITFMITCFRYSLVWLMFLLAATRGMQDLSFQPGMEPTPPAVEVNRWTSKEVSSVT